MATGSLVDDLVLLLIILLVLLDFQWLFMGIVDCNTWTQRLLRLLAVVPLLLLDFVVWSVLGLTVELIREYRHNRLARLQRHRTLDADPESAPLLTRSTRTTRAGRTLPNVFGTIPALDIASIDMAGLENGAQVQSLPTCLVDLPLDDVSQIAILSWKWDFKTGSKEEPSMNISCAIKYAKMHGIRYLLVDIISLDQSLPADLLLPQVSLFAALYATIPVIAAYDDSRFVFHYIILRPWIFSEIKNMLDNPHKIVYVGHIKDSHGTFEGSISRWLTGIQLRSRVMHTNIVKQLRFAWATDFGMCLLHLLNGSISMANLYDLKFILTPLADILLEAERLGSQHDYLMTAILMASASRFRRAPYYTTSSTFTSLPYCKYTIKSYRRDEGYAEDRATREWSLRIGHYEKHTILLDNCELATFEAYHEDWREGQHARYSLKTRKGMERKILTMLGLEYGNVARVMELQRELQLLLGGQGYIEDPQVEVVRIRL